MCLDLLPAAVRPVRVINEPAGGWSSYRRRGELAEIHFNEILDLSEDKDDGSLFQICHLPCLPPPHLLFLLLFQPFRNRTEAGARA